MNVDTLVQEIYSEIGLAKPVEILYFENVEEAFQDFKSWSQRVEGVLTCFWSYQFPMVGPWSYWSIFHLEKDNYRLDVKRASNENGCFVYGKHIGSEPSATLSPDVYKKVCGQLELKRFDLQADELLDSILDRYESELEYFDERLIEQDPTCQMGVDEFIFLGNFEWLQKEAWLLKEFSCTYQIPINHRMYKLIDEISKCKKLFLTFTNMVLVVNVA